MTKNKIRTKRQEFYWLTTFRQSYSMIFMVTTSKDVITVNCMTVDKCCGHFFFYLSFCLCKCHAIILWLNNILLLPRYLLVKEIEHTYLCISLTFYLFLICNDHNIYYMYLINFTAGIEWVSYNNDISLIVNIFKWWQIVLTKNGCVSCGLARDILVYVIL